ncbi:PREDICTED: regulatory solute carrier protein family 1 member 1 [Merops nubicus]|uniref:regulatory solute carrier protein family 1 member 1 n=1 Tax=Merops nubicus TaxID=57421 RepID=UPI0004F06FF3|nr:PREDICTED: regulatory solute carrier protein family 1 member 1 [Merops nubicus]
MVLGSAAQKNSDKETTSLEKPSLPASDGFQNPVQSSGLNSKICNPTNQLLDRSVSAPASICSSESSLAEPTDPRAVNCVQTEAFMEVDVVEQSVAEAHSLEREQKWQAGNRSVVDPNSDTFSMEVESLKSAASLSDSLSTGDVLRVHQLDTDPGRPSEEPCSSLASALKELHKLLIISRKGECAAQDARRLLTGAPQRSSSSAPGGPWPLGGHEEPLLSPPAGYPGLPLGAPPPPAFPAADVDRILSAGFSTREALEALERADGNADLALLILLAKSIVVPT